MVAWKQEAITGYDVVPRNARHTQQKQPVSPLSQDTTERNVQRYIKDRWRWHMGFLSKVLPPHTLHHNLLELFPKPSTIPTNTINKQTTPHPPTMPLDNKNQNTGVTGAGKMVTSTIGNTVGGLTNTVGGIVGAAGRGLGETVNGATGGLGKPLGDGIANVGTGVEGGAASVAKGVKDAGEWKTN